jgi:hypothetical protein
MMTARYRIDLLGDELVVIIDHFNFVGSQGCLVFDNPVPAHQDASVKNHVRKLLGATAILCHPDQPRGSFFIGFNDWKSEGTRRKQEENV